MDTLLSSTILSCSSGLTVNKVIPACSTSICCLFKPSLQRKRETSNMKYFSCPAFGYAGCLKGANVHTQQPMVHSVNVARCEAQEGNSNSLDIWLGRAAMLGFVSVVAVEISTGKGVLENAGLSTPLPTLALALTAVVGAVTAFGIFRSASDDN